MPYDPEIEDMDPILKLWMFENWVADQNDDVEMVKNHAYLVGSFINPEAVKKLLGESGQVHKSSDEEFEASTQMVVDDAKIEKKKTKRKRKLKG